MSVVVALNKRQTKNEEDEPRTRTKLEWLFCHHHIHTTGIHAEFDGEKPSNRKLLCAARKCAVDRNEGSRTEHENHFPSDTYVVNRKKLHPSMR